MHLPLQSCVAQHKGLEAVSAWVLQHAGECTGHLWREFVVLLLHTLKVFVVSKGRYQRQEQPGQ